MEESGVNTPRGARWICASKISDNGNSILQAQFEHRSQEPFEHRLVPFSVVRFAGELCQRYGSLTKDFKEKSRGQSAFDQSSHNGERRIDTIARKPGSVAYEKRLRVTNDSPLTYC